MRKIIGSLLCAGALAASGCGPEFPEITVAGQKLQFKDQSYGQSGGTGGLYCNALDKRGQTEVFITDFSLCSVLKPPPTMNDNRSIFHSSANTGLRLIFSSQEDVIKKAPPVTELKVAKTSFCDNNALGAEAVAFFAHNPEGSATYDVLLEAESGTIKVNYFASPSNAVGTFELVFAGEKVTGSFNAPYCKSLVPGLGK